jgi:GntR family transcriptional regulator
MRNLLRVDPKDAIPIWHQIEEGLHRLVLSRRLAPGAVVPSVRDLAKDLRVNPATVAKAYQRLVDAGVLSTRRGEGTFVAEDVPQLRARERKVLLQEGALRYASLSLGAGASSAEAEDALRKAWSSLANYDARQENEEQR